MCCVVLWVACEAVLSPDTDAASVPAPAIRPVAFTERGEIPKNCDAVDEKAGIEIRPGRRFRRGYSPRTAMCKLNRRARGPGIVTVVTSYLNWLNKTVSCAYGRGVKSVDAGGSKTRPQASHSRRTC